MANMTPIPPQPLLQSNLRILLINFHNKLPSTNRWENLLQRAYSPCVIHDPRVLQSPRHRNPLIWVLQEHPLREIPRRIRYFAPRVVFERDLGLFVPHVNLLRGYIVERKIPGQKRKQNHPGRENIAVSVDLEFKDLWRDVARGPTFRGVFDLRLEIRDPEIAEFILGFPVVVAEDVF